jgi:uncharacterized protein with FMN-binding domain
MELQRRIENNMRSKTKMKKKTKIILTIVVAFLIFGVGIGAVVLNKISKSMVIQPVNNVNLQQVSDGTYLGNAKNDIIVVEVKVTVAGHKITSIDILRHDNGFGGKAEAIVDNIISKQSLEVDTISSATYSSNIILKAVENALEKGVNH